MNTLYLVKVIAAVLLIGCTLATVNTEVKIGFLDAIMFIVVAVLLII